MYLPICFIKTVDPQSRAFTGSNVFCSEMDTCAVCSCEMVSNHRVLQTSIPRIPKRIFQLSIPAYYSVPFMLSLTSIQFAKL